MRSPARSRHSPVCLPLWLLFHQLRYTATRLRISFLRLIFHTVFCVLFCLILHFYLTHPVTTYLPTNPPDQASHKPLTGTVTARPPAALPHHLRPPPPITP